MPSPSSHPFDAPEQLPARMINEYAYCPRLFYLEYVQGEWAHNLETLEGRSAHRRADKVGGAVPAPGSAEDARIHARSVSVGSSALGAIAVVDVLEGEGSRVTPVDYKRGAPPDTPERAWEPERVQVCLQGLLLRENGYECEGAVLYFVAAKTRVSVPFDDALVARTREVLEQARACAQAGQMPPPLVNSPKCVRCSLAGICLPDEVNLLRKLSEVESETEYAAACGAEYGAECAADFATSTADDPGPGTGPTGQWGDGSPAELGSAAFAAALQLELDADDAGEQDLEGSGCDEAPGEPGGAGVPSSRPPRGEVLEPRRLQTARDERIPLYVQGQGYQIGLSGEVLEVREKGKVVENVRLIDVSQVSLFGNVQVTAQALRELIDRDIPVLHLSYGGWLVGVTTPPPHKNIELRRKQFEAAAAPARCLELARAMTDGKIRNCRTLLRRNARPVSPQTLRALADSRRDCAEVQSLASLLGVEGNAARIYFEALPTMLRPPAGEEVAFDFAGRNRRPPKDPVNALLSYVYALLTKDLVVATLAVGFDPYLGFYHQPRYGRPALALDLMEEFRPLLGDSVVLGLINTGEVRAGDFILRAGGCALTEGGRRRVLEAYERRTDSLVTHPIFGYTLSYRRVLEVQARLLARCLLGELSTYPAFYTR